jgi:hypothetical protein
MAFYDDMMSQPSRSPAGIHTFDGELLIDLPATYNSQFVGDHEKGELVRFRQGGTTLLDNIVLHRSGRGGPNGAPGRDLEKDTIIVTTGELATLPDELQTRFWSYEQTPGTGRRAGNTRPPRTS